MLQYLALSQHHIEWPYEHDSSHFSARRAGIVTNALIIHTSIVSAWYKTRKGIGPTQTFTRGLCLFSLVPSIIWLKKSLNDIQIWTAMHQFFALYTIVKLYGMRKHDKITTWLQHLTSWFSFELQSIANQWESAFHSWNWLHLPPFMYVAFNWII